MDYSYQGLNPSFQLAAMTTSFSLVLEKPLFVFWVQQTFFSACCHDNLVPRSQSFFPAWCHDNLLWSSFRAAPLFVDLGAINHNTNDLKGTFGKTWLFFQYLGIRYFENLKRNIHKMFIYGYFVMLPNTKKQNT